MKRLLKIGGYLLSGIVTVLLIAAAAVYGFSESRYRKEYTISPVPLRVPVESASVARGEHIVHTFGGCVECHGENLAGKKVVDDPVLARIAGLNLTSGRGGVGPLSDTDYERAIRHGIKPNGQPLKLMPSMDYQHLSDADLAAVIAYIRTRPPVDNAVPAASVGPLGRVLFVTGKMPMISAERIDHAKQPPVQVTPTPTAEYGDYLASISCKGCHGTQLAGGPIEGAPPDWPQAANLTPAGSLGSWGEEDFVRTIRTGVRPNGIPMNPVMPFRLLRNLTDPELHALWLYLKTLPPVGGPPVKVAAN